MKTNKVESKAIPFKTCTFFALFPFFFGYSIFAAVVRFVYIK